MKQYITDLKSNAHDCGLCLCNAHVILFNRGRQEMLSELLSDIEGTITMYYNDNMPNIILCSGLTANFLLLKYPDMIRDHCYWESFEEAYLRDMDVASGMSNYGYVTSTIDYAHRGMKPLNLKVEKPEHEKTIEERGYFESRPRIP